MHQLFDFQVPEMNTSEKQPIKLSSPPLNGMCLVGTTQFLLCNNVEIIFPLRGKPDLNAKTLPFCFLERSSLPLVGKAFKINGKFLHPFAAAQEGSKILASL